MTDLFTLKSKCRWGELSALPSFFVPSFFAEHIFQESELNGHHNKFNLIFGKSRFIWIQIRKATSEIPTDQVHTNFDVNQTSLIEHQTYQTKFDPTAYKYSLIHI